MYRGEFSEPPLPFPYARMTIGFLAASFEPFFVFPPNFLLIFQVFSSTGSVEDFCEKLREVIEIPLKIVNSFESSKSNNPSENRLVLRFIEPFNGRPHIVTCQTYMVSRPSNKEYYCSVCSMYLQYGFNETSHEETVHVVAIDPITLKLEDQSVRVYSDRMPTLTKNHLRQIRDKAKEAHNIVYQSQFQLRHLGWDAMVDIDENVVFFEAQPSGMRLARDAIMVGWEQTMASWWELNIMGVKE